MLNVMPQVRLPLEPLMVLTEAHAAHARERNHGNDDALGVSNPVTTLARWVGVTKRTVHRWKAAGGIPLYSADTAAIRVGFHPSEVWPEWWDACLEQDRIEDEWTLTFSFTPGERTKRRELVRQYEQIERAQERLQGVS